MPLGNPQDYIKQGMSPGAAQAKAFPGGGGGSSTAARPLPTAPTSATQGIGGGPRGSNMTGAAQNLLSALQRLIQQGQQLGLMPQIPAMIQQAGTAAARRTGISGPPRPPMGGGGGVPRPPTAGPPGGGMAGGPPGGGMPGRKPPGMI